MSPRPPRALAAHPSPSPRRRPASIVVAAIAFGLLLWALLPVTLGPGDRDEFADLKSVVETLPHGRPWTDDDLEPWAAWFWPSRYAIVRVAPPREPPVLGRDHARVPFPLDDTDWLALTRRPASRG